jgi:hypothetical protein
MKPKVRSTAKANQEIHCTIFNINNVLALGEASNAGQEYATKKATAKKVKVLPHNFDTRSVLLI